MRPHDQMLNFLSHAIQIFPRKASPRNIACEETGRGGKRRESSLSFRSRSSDSFRGKSLRGSGRIKEGEVLAEAGVQWAYDRLESGGMLRRDGSGEDDY